MPFFLFLAGVIRGRRVIHSVPVDDLTSRFGVACVTHQLTGVILDEICAGISFQLVLTIDPLQFIASVWLE